MGCRLNHQTDSPKLKRIRAKMQWPAFSPTPRQSKHSTRYDDCRIHLALVWRSPSVNDEDLLMVRPSRRKMRRRNELSTSDGTNARLSRRKVYWHSHAGRGDAAI